VDALTTEALCDADQRCCELCNDCTIEVPEYAAVGRPQYERPVDDPVQRQGDIAANAIAREQLRQLHVDLDAGFGTNRWPQVFGMDWSETSLNR
jgi:hypothetical protein